MFTTYMYIENRDRGSHLYSGEKIDSFSEVLEAFDNLDGDRRPLILIAEAPPEPESGNPYSGEAMEIASGGEGYTCTIYKDPDNETFVMLSHDSTDNSYKVISRPYPDRIPANQVVGKNDVLEAIRQFAEDGSMTPLYKWERVG